MLNENAYIDYRKNDIHGTVQYPAMMVAPVQNEILKETFDQLAIKSIFDPCHGSGTALYEAFTIDPIISLYGCDINPLANLITRAKLGGVSRYIHENKHRLFQHLKNDEHEPINFVNEHKWFREDILVELKRIRSAIMQITSTQDRIVCWCIFSDIVRRYSNTRATTYKLHIKKDSTINNIKNKVISDFECKLENAIPYYKKSSNYYCLYKCDAIELCSKTTANCYDLTITSPPYGDNHTTVAYGQFSSLALQLINKRDLVLEGWELSNYSIIDSRSMGGSTTKKIIEHSVDKQFIEKILKPISDRKRPKVMSFFVDYFQFLRSISRVTDKCIIMTLGNRTVDGYSINLNSVTTQYLEMLGWRLVDEYKRKIPIKRVPTSVSSVNNSPVGSMLIEYTVVFKKLSATIL